MHNPAACCGFKLLPLIGLLVLGGAQTPARAFPADAPRTVEIKDTNYPIPASNVYFVAPAAPDGPGRDTNTGTVTAPWTAQKALAVAPAGATIVFRGGTYRNVDVVRVAKRLTLQAFPHEKPWLKGSVLVTGWARSGAAWVKTGWARQFPPNVGSVYIDDDYPMAGHRDMVFIDNQPQTQVAQLADVKPGTFFVDYDQDKLYLGDDPGGKTVEATAYTRALYLEDNPTHDPTGTIVRGLGFTHYADDGVAVHCPNVVLENNTFAWNGQEGAGGGGPTNLILRGNTFSGNGRKGFSASAAHGLLAENNTFSYNNVEIFDRGWDAAGIKIVHSRDFTLRGNLVRRNYGNGIWIDVSCLRATIVHNTSRSNDGNGVMVELSHDAIVAFNLCYSHRYGAGIAVWDSSHIRVVNNTLAGNKKAVVVTDTTRVNNPTDSDVQPGESRTDFEAGATWITHDVALKNNIFSNTGGTSPGPLVDATPTLPQTGSSIQISALDTNAYYRTDAATPAHVVKWSLGSSNSTYSTLAAFRSAHPSYERHGFAKDDEAVNPFFVDEAGGNYHLKPGSVAINRGEPLPLDIAQAAHRPANVPVHLGALDVYNPAPSVHLTAPVDGAAFTASANIILNATASDNGGTIAKVEFYNGVTLLHTEFASPYSYIWNNVAPGSYTLTAKAYDTLGTATTSAPVRITVTAAGPAPVPTPALVNLAPGKSATQSSTPGGTTSGANRAQLAIDNNPDGNWNHGSVTHTNLDKQPWWQLDLGASRAIATMELFNRTDGASERLSNFVVLVSDTPFTSNDLHTTLVQPGVWHFYHGATAGSPTSISVHRMGRYVRVQLMGTNFLSIAEIKVLGYADALPNLAQGKTATQSSRPQGTPAPSAALDGNLDGVWSGGSVTHTGLDKQAWWQVDLGASRAITTLNLFNRTDNSQARLSNVHVFVTEQPFTSTDLNTTLEQPGVWHSYVAGTVGAPTSVPVHRSGRYVRVQLGNTGYLSLAEVQVIGFPDQSPDLNLAQGRSATQSSRPAGTPPAGAALDGNTNGAWSGGSVTHTHREAQPWWQVDLGQSQSLTRVELFNRIDNSQERLGDFFVLVSDAPFASANLQATLSQPGVWATHVPVQAGTPTSVALHRTGRYVRVQLMGTDYLSIAEVKVQGQTITTTSQAGTALAGAATAPVVKSAASTPSHPAAAPKAPRSAAPFEAVPLAAPVAGFRAASRRQGLGTGLLAEYFDAINGTNRKTVRIDRAVDFDWGRGIPPGTALTSPDTWSVRWSGFIEAPVSGIYTFTTTSDDGIRLQVDGKPLIDNWTGHSPTDDHGILHLQAGRRYPIRIEYFESVKSAKVKLWWTYAGQAKQIVPMRRLYPGP